MTMMMMAFQRWTGCEPSITTFLQVFVRCLLQRSFQPKSQNTNYSSRTLLQLIKFLSPTSGTHYFFLLNLIRLDNSINFTINLTLHFSSTFSFSLTFVNRPKPSIPFNPGSPKNAQPGVVSVVFHSTKNVPLFITTYPSSFNSPVQATAVNGNDHPSAPILIHLGCTPPADVPFLNLPPPSTYLPEPTPNLIKQMENQPLVTSPFPVVIHSL